MGSKHLPYAKYTSIMRKLDNKLKKDILEHQEKILIYQDHFQMKNCLCIKVQQQELLTYKPMDSLF